MTYEEALNYGMNLSPIQARNDLERYLLRGERPIYKAVAMGMQALEKQIPKKPTPYKGFDGKCVCCGVIFLDASTNYCGNCGQALDWTND